MNLWRKSHGLAGNSEAALVLTPTAPPKELTEHCRKIPTRKAETS